MHADPRRDVDDAQSRYAERLHVEPDRGDPVVRHVMLDAQRLGQLVHQGDDEWALLYLVDGEYRDSLNYLQATLEHVEEADRHGVGWVADALARGELRADGGER